MNCQERKAGQPLSETRNPEEVGEMFSKIAPRYDMMNRAMCLGFDMLWRRRLVRAACENLPECGAKILDMACGSGDVAFALEDALSARGMQRSSEIVCADFSRGMLALAESKAAARLAKGKCKVKKSFVFADCSSLDFPDESFDAATISFGFRNFSDRAKCLRELSRVLRKGGGLFLLEVSRANALLSPIQDFLMRYPIPLLAALLGCDKSSYEYLARTTREFPEQDELLKLVNANGFAGARSRTMAFGAVALTSARKA